MTPLDDFQKRYLDELEAAANVLSTLESAAQAEAWASGAIAEWQALSGAAGALAGHLADSSPLAAALIKWFEGGDAPESAEPLWIGDLGRSELTRVVQLTQADAPDDVGLILEYSLDGQPDHDLSVSIEQGRLAGVTVGPTGLIDGIEEDTEGQGSDLVAVEVDSASILNLVSAALTEPAEDLSATSEANIPLLVKRLGTGSGPTVNQLKEGQLVSPDSRDREDDLWCVDVVQSALRKQLAAAAPRSVDDAVEAFGALLAAGDPDAHTVLEVAGVDVAGREIAGTANLDTLLTAVGAYFSPVDLSAHSKAGFDALVLLEPVDWVGAVLGLVRSSANTPPIDGATLVTFINRAPEITTTISKRDAPQLAWTFDQMLFAWEVTGVITDEGAVTEAGRWLIGQAFVKTLS